VLESLDHMKKESGRAREASRWLETQLHKGNRFLRAQKASESLALPLITSPKKRDKDARSENSPEYFVFAYI
jgi:protein SMG5